MHDEALGNIVIDLGRLRNMSVHKVCINTCVYNIYKEQQILFHEWSDMPILIKRNQQNKNETMMNLKVAT